MRWAAVGVCAILSLVIARAADARALCAKPEEMSAIQTSAIQQELMVAALTCNEVARFNAFQTGFGSELRIEDAILAHMFKRLYGARRGEAAYHAFKTKLANDSSMRSIHDNPGYCHEADSLLSTALAPAKPALIAFVNSATVVLAQSPAQACTMRADAVTAKRAARRARRAARLAQ
jgi:hypothetical protein